MTFKVLAVCILLSSIQKGFSQVSGDIKKAKEDESLFMDGNRVPELISADFELTEGPAVNNKGEIFFSDLVQDRIYKYGLDGSLEIYQNNIGRLSGIFIDGNNNLIGCSSSQHSLIALSPDRSLVTLAQGYDGLHFNGPNDLWVNRNGDIYFTDPYYPPVHHDVKPLESDTLQQRVFLYSANLQKVIAVDSTLTKPNGIVGSKDGKLLYVADIGSKRTFIYNINSQGLLTDKRIFIAQGADGITLDNRGNLYLTGKEVTVINPQGSIIAKISVAAPKVTNVCFGGAKRNLLFITAGNKVFRLPMSVHGIE